MFLSDSLLWHVTSSEQFGIRSGKFDSRPGQTCLRFTYLLTGSLRLRVCLGPSSSSTSGLLSEHGHRIAHTLARAVPFRLMIRR